MPWDEFFSGLGMADVGVKDGPQIVLHDERFFQVRQSSHMKTWMAH